MQLNGIIVGGLIPALFFGISGIFVKASTSSGIGLGVYLLAVGVGVLVAGMVFYYFEPEVDINICSGLFAWSAGFFWAVGGGLLALALLKYGTPIATLVPLYNMNTLITVLLGLIIFSEWQDVNLMKLLWGTLLIMVGGSLVATS